jgi:hypothetical protein
MLTEQGFAATTSFLVAFLGCTIGANGTDISGTIASTLTLTGDSKFVGDVPCTANASPCIAIGASNITLDLASFTITGPWRFGNGLRRRSLSVCVG